MPHFKLNTFYDAKKVHKNATMKKKWQFLYSRKDSDRPDDI